MANTLDSLPVLPADSFPDGGSSSRRNSSTAMAERIPSVPSMAVLEELDDEGEEEADDDDDDDCGEEEKKDDEAEEDAREKVKEDSKRGGDAPETPRQNNANRRGRWPSPSPSRSREMASTEGGLHLPLGNSSPILRRHMTATATASASVGSNSFFVHSPSAASPSLKTAVAASPSLPTLMAEGDGGRGDTRGNGLSPRVSRGCHRPPLSSSNAAGGKEADRNDEETEEDVAPDEGVVTDNPMDIEMEPSSSFSSRRHVETLRHCHEQRDEPTMTTLEKESLLQWQRECREHETSHLGETLLNVKVLMQQRRRRQREDAVEQRDRRERQQRQQVPAVDGVAGGAASNPTEMSRPQQPSNEYDDEILKMELLQRHRSWYQSDGKLIVLQSLPCMSLRDGGVVAVPIGTVSALDGSHGHHHHHRRPITLSPGSVVVADEVIALDSRSLKVIRHHRDEDGEADTLDAKPLFERETPTLQMLKISSPHRGYIVSQMHDYPYLLPGLPSSYVDTRNWYWRVTCQPDGAFVRRGLELVSDHVDTLPFGSICRVEKKVVNSMGLNRLRVVGYSEKTREKREGTDETRTTRMTSSSSGSESEDPTTGNGRERGNNGKRDALRNLIKKRREGSSSTLPSLSSSERVNELKHDHDDDRDNSNDDDARIAFGKNKVTGWISEFLNPLSGQRGPVAAPIPFPVPALYRVRHADGVIIRSGVELSTSQIGFAPKGTVLAIVGRAYSDHPREQCIERLRLAGGGGWISASLNRPPPGDEDLVEFIGIDGSYDPNHPELYHFEAQRKVMRELEAQHNDDGRQGNDDDDNHDANQLEDIRYRRQRSLLGADLSEINEDDWTDRQSSISDSDDATPAESMAATTNPNNHATSSVPTLFRSGAAAGMTGLMRGAMGGSGNILAGGGSARHPSQSYHQHHHSDPQQNRCLICLSDERTATLVHGETGHIACCLTCARILKARGDNCPVCRLPIDLVIQQFWA